MKCNLVLASASPRRRELLENAGIVFSVRVAPVEEKKGENESPAEYVKRLATEKTVGVSASPHEVVLGADTTVVVDGKILEKPVDDEDARRMLRLLSGRRHEVLTGICLRWPENRLMVDCESTQVTFSELSEAEIEEYVASGEPRDKAGAYGIQGRASKFVERIEGCYFNIVGLPVPLVYRHLRDA